MTKGIFITATGTDIGKTYITSSIIKTLRNSGFNAGYYKAALSGAVVENNEIIECDGLEVLKKSGIKGKIENRVSYIMETPVSPHLASKIENINIDIEKIKMDFNKLKKEHDILIVEGSGGIVCPLNIDSGLMLVDVIKELSLDIIIVSDPGVGTINSTVLTAEYAKNHGINVKGIILNNYEKNNKVHSDNKKVIELLTGVKVIDVVEKNMEINLDSSEVLRLLKEI